MGALLSLFWLVREMRYYRDTLNIKTRRYFRKHTGELQQNIRMLRQSRCAKATLSFNHSI